MLSRQSFATILVVLALARAVPAQAQIDCSNPDNLCTGDPCVVPAVLVATPCTADFGDRTLVLSGLFRFLLTSNGYSEGVLTLSAGTIDVQNTMRGVRHLTLIASGDVDLHEPLTATGPPYLVPQDQPSVTIQAGGDVHLRGFVRAGMLPRYKPGRITIDAGGNLTADRKLTTAYGGLVDLSAGGDIIVGGVDVSARAFYPSDGGTVVIDAAGTVTMQRPIRAAGQSDGGQVTVSGDAGVTLERGADVRATGGLYYGWDAGSIDVSSAAGPVTVLKRVLAKGDVSGGQIRVSGATVLLDGRFDVRARTGTTGAGTIEAMATGDLTASGSFTCAPDGCLAFNAGGTLDTTGATLDTTPVLDCPGSASGAFIDAPAALVP